MANLLITKNSSENGLFFNLAIYFIKSKNLIIQDSSDILLLCPCQHNELKMYKNNHFLKVYPYV